MNRVQVIGSIGSGNDSGYGNGSGEGSGKVLVLVRVLCQVMTHWILLADVLVISQVTGIVSGKDILVMVLVRFWCSVLVLVKVLVSDDGSSVL